MQSCKIANLSHVLCYMDQDNSENLQHWNNFLVIFDIIQFNYWYVEYKKDYYNQLAFEDKTNIKCNA